MLAVLKTLGHIVLNETNWPVGRPGDNEWQERIVNLLEDQYPEHAAAVRADLSCVRFRPEEVVGASAKDGWAHDFVAAEAAGSEVLADMAAAGKLA
jgi:hypothetical protein